MKTIVISVFALLLTVCLVNCTSVQTPISLSEIDLKQMILVPSSEMPEGYLATKTKDSLPNLDVPEPTKLIWQQLETQDAVAGGVIVYLYESTLDVKDAYAAEVSMKRTIADTINETSLVGEHATISSYQIDQTVTDLVFTRCYTVVTIRMLDIVDENVIIEYGKQLDANIIKYICR